jgi:replicative DNA helicase
MDAERQIIGSLLLDQSRIDDMRSISADMFVDPTLGKIFGIYANANGKEVNQLVIIPQITTSYQTEQQCFKLLADIVSEHDAGISDSFCEDYILQDYKSRKVNELINYSLITPNSVDLFLDDIRNLSENFVKEDADRTMSLAELTALSGEYFTENHRIKYQLGFPNLDKAIGGIDDGDVLIIAARPSVGKSAFALQIGRKFGMDGYRVGYFNLEMGTKQIYERAIASASGIDMSRIRLATNYLNDEQSQFESGNQKLMGERNFFVITGTQSIKTMRAKQNKERYDVIIVDYMQLIVSSGNRGGNRASEVGDISRGLKAIATDFGIPVIALSQLNRASERTKDKEPSLADLRESGDIEQDASVVLMMWNSNDDDKTEKTMKVEKSRNGFNDRLVLYFDGKHMNFEEFDTGDFRDKRDNEDLPWS